ncbi:MAG: hypothetical protein ACU0BN_13970 [Sulfitobacter sp.]
MLCFTGFLARGSTSFGTGVADLQVVEYGGESWLLADSVEKLEIFSLPNFRQIPAQ